jgi:hypothetical protein
MGRPLVLMPLQLALVLSGKTALGASSGRPHPGGFPQIIPNLSRLGVKCGQSVFHTSLYSNWQPVITISKLCYEGVLLYNVRDRTLLQCMFISNGTFVLYAVPCMQCSVIDNGGLRVLVLVRSTWP